MSVFSDPNSMKLLQNLLNPKQKDDSDTDTEDDEAIPSTSASASKSSSKDMGPGNLAVKLHNKPKKSSPYDALPPKKPENVQNIEEWHEALLKEDAQILDKRLQPKFSIAYRQQISTEDVYLQLNNRTGATTSCEDMVLEILLPDDETPVDKMGLNITETEIELSTAMYYLKMPFSYRINVDRSTANYKVKTKTLIVTLRLVRELDFVHF